jgi:hypothetical protein
MRARASAPVVPWVSVAVVLLFALHDRFELVENRLLILIAAAFAAAGIVLRQRDARTDAARSPEARSLRRRTILAAVTLGAVSLALAIVRALVAPRFGLRADLVAALVPPLLGWSVFLLLPIGFAPAPVSPSSETPVSRRALVSITAGTFAAVWIFTVARTHFDNIDEVLYGLQAHRFAIGHATWALDPELQRFVKLPLMVVTPTSVYSQYPPGYPAILALFVRIGIPSLCGATLGALAVLATYRLGSRIAVPSVGMIAAVLLATNGLFLRWSASYMSHAAAMTAVCLAAWLLVDATERSDRQREVESALAGVLLGIAFAVRPVTALAIGLSIWLSLLARRFGWTRLRRVTVMVCVGAALPFAALLAYNAATNGDPMRLGYQAAQGHLNDVGFGTRGIILYDRDVQPVVSASQFTFADALRNELAVAVWPFARDLFPVWWLLPLVAVAVAYRLRVRWAVVAAFAILPLVNFFFFGNGERLHVELLPFAFVGAALVVRRVHEVDPRAARALVVFLVGANVVTSVTRIAGDRWDRVRLPKDSEVLARALRDSSRGSTGLLVFVRNPPLSEPLLIGLSQFNFGRFPGQVVVARDLGAENGRLLCRLPGYRVLVAESATAAREARLVSPTDTMLAASHCDRHPPTSPSSPPA